MTVLLEWVTAQLSPSDISQAKKGFAEPFGTPSVHPWLLLEIQCNHMSRCGNGVSVSVIIVLHGCMSCTDISCFPENQLHLIL